MNGSTFAVYGSPKCANAMSSRIVNDRATLGPGAQQTPAAAMSTPNAAPCILRFINYLVNTLKGVCRFVRRGSAHVGRLAMDQNPDRRWSTVGDYSTDLRRRSRCS